MSRSPWLLLLMIGGCSSNTVDDIAMPDGGQTGSHDLAMKMSGDGGTPPTGMGLFPPSAPWTKDVSGSNGTVASDSNDVITWLANNGGWGNGNVFQIDLSFHILESDGKTLPLMEAGGYTLPDCDESPTVPIPAVGAIEGSTDYTCDAANNDCHLLVVDRGANKLYELYQSNIANNVVSSTCLVIWDLTHVYPPSGRGEQCTSADAAGFPIAALLFTPDEAATGHIDHAIRFALPNNRMRSQTYLHPASHAGAPSAPSPAPIYGSHFRLRQDFNVATLPSPASRTIATALQKYGMYLSDGGNITLMGTDDQFTKAKWSDANLNLDTHDLKSLKVTDFELMDHDAPIALTYDCVRNP